MTNRSDESNTLSADDGAIRAEYDWTDTPASTAVVETVAVACDCEPTELDPLYEVVDPDALDEVVRSSGDGPVVGGTTVTFEVADRSVTIDDGGAVVVRPAGSGSNGVRG